MRKQLQLLIVLLLALPIGMLAQGTTWETATEIGSGGSGTATLDDKQGEAWFKIEVPQDGKVTFTQTLSGDLKMYNVNFCWWNAAAAWGRGSIENRTSMGYYPESGRTMEVTDVGQGTYYVQVVRNGGSGTCKLDYKFTASSYVNDEEPNDENGQGTTLANGQTVQGHLGYLDGKDYRDVDDWYKIEVPQDGCVDLTYECEEAYNLELYKIYFCWWNAGGAWGRGTYDERAGTGYYVKNGTLTITDVGAGTY